MKIKRLALTRMTLLRWTSFRLRALRLIPLKPILSACFARHSSAPTAPGKVALLTTSLHPTCLLGQEGAQPGKGLGYVVFVQHSHVLPVAKRMSLGKLYLPQSRLIASFFRPELALSASSLLTSKKGKEHLPIMYPSFSFTHHGRKDKGKAEAEAETEVVTEPEQVTRDGSVLSSQENDAEGGDTQPTVPRADEDEEACKRREAAEQAAREKRWRAELEREVEGSGGAVVNSCGHLMHVECRHQYSLSIARDINLNRPTIDPMLTPAAVAQVN